MADKYNFSFMHGDSLVKDCELRLLSLAAESRLAIVKRVVWLSSRESFGYRQESRLAIVKRVVWLSSRESFGYRQESRLAIVKRVVWLSSRESFGYRQESRLAIVKRVVWLSSRESFGYRQESRLAIVKRVVWLSSRESFGYRQESRLAIVKRVGMPRPKKRATIAKRLYAQRRANTEVTLNPLKKNEALLSPKAGSIENPCKLASVNASENIANSHLSNTQTLSNPCKPLQTLENPCKPLKPIENPCKPLKTLENSCKPLQTLANSCKPLKTLENPCKLVSVNLANLHLSNAQTLANPCKPLKTLENFPQKSVQKGSLGQAVGSSFPRPSGKALYSEVVKRSSKVCESVKTEVRTYDFQVDSGKVSRPQMRYPMKSKSKPMQSEQNIPASSHESALGVCSDFPQKPMLKGSFDQADARFGNSRNRQCGAISLTAVLKSKLKNVLMWSTPDLDGVLVAGTRLYEYLKKHGNIKDRQVKGRNYIAVHELPRRHMLGNTTFSIEYTHSLTGFVNVNEYHEYDQAISSVAMPLDVALQQTLLSADAFLLTICANTSAVIKQGSWYAVVDSHAIRTDTSCVVYHSTIESLYNYINEMAQLFGEPEPPFEITGVLVHADAEVSDPLQEAGSSSFPCSSGKTLLKRTTKVRESVKTEPKTPDYSVPVDELADVRNPNLPTQTASNVLPSKGKRLRKEKHLELSGKRVTKSHVETVVTDDLMITDVSVPDVFFSPLTHNDKQALCELIQMSNDNSDHNVINFGPISAPCQTKTIKPDGNCFFRSLAHVICGSEEKHLKVRRAVVKHFKMNTPLFERYVRSEYSSAEDYLTRSRMFYSGSWVTEIDIFVAADLFKTTIMTFNDGRWNAYKPNGEVFTQNAIYLKHCNRNHYEVVTCVKHRDRDSVCAGACGNVVSNEVSKPCLRKRKVSDAAECCPTKRHRERYHNDSEYRQKQLTYKKSKYGNDPEYRQNKIEHAKAKYCDDTVYRGKKIEYAKTKYSDDTVYRGKKIEYAKTKYSDDTVYRGKKIEYAKTKYSDDTVYRGKKIEYAKTKYSDDTVYRGKKLNMPKQNILMTQFTGGKKLNMPKQNILKTQFTGGKKLNLRKQNTVEIDITKREKRELFVTNI
ncbi:uncharacterized protein LOC113070050 [Carassius auratus]|uniref:ubiquitinyl hydrolase 1 n=1 Tax=Carassius auratus TaxID=7957 RepID=A0A6P6MR21_CARAU|nr:uncharacterized protein LOC113070050 [Carassius auratus]